MLLVCLILTQWNRGRLPVVDNIAAVRGLSAEEGSRRYPVRVKAVCLYHDGLRRQLFVDDGTGGSRVELLDERAEYYSGQILYLHGISAPGSDGAYIANASVTRTEHAAFNIQPGRPTPAQFDRPDRPYRYVEVRGSVESWHLSADGRLLANLRWGGLIVDAIIMNKSDIRTDRLDGATVTMRGVSQTQ